MKYLFLLSLAILMSFSFFNNAQAITTHTAIMRANDAPYVPPARVGRIAPRDCPRLCPPGAPRSQLCRLSCP